MSQSAASRALSSLEVELGMLLALRRPNGVELTAVGQRVVRHARVATSTYQAIRDEVASSRGSPQLQLRIGAVPTAIATRLPHLLRVFARGSPPVNVMVVEGSDSEVQDWLDDRVVDVATLTTSHQGYVAVRWFTDEYVAIFHRSSELVDKPSIRPTELCGPPFVMSSAGCGPAIEKLFESAGCQPSITCTARDLRTIVHLVAERIGISVVPTSAGPFPASVISRPLEPARPRTVYLAASDPPGPAARRLLDSAQERGSPEPDSGRAPSPLGQPATRPGDSGILKLGVEHTGQDRASR